MVIRTTTMKMSADAPIWNSRQALCSRLRALALFSALSFGLVARGSYLASAARARCRSIRWRHSAYSLVLGRYSNDLHHSSSDSSRCIDEQLPSTSTATKNPNLGIIATFPRKPRPPDEQGQNSGVYGGLVGSKPCSSRRPHQHEAVKFRSRDRRCVCDSASAVARVPHSVCSEGSPFDRQSLGPDYFRRRLRLYSR